MPFTASPPPSTWTLDNGYISAAAVKREATLPPAAVYTPPLPPTPHATAPHVIIPHLTPSDIRDFLSRALGLAADGVDAARAGVDALRALHDALADGVAELAATREALTELAREATLVGRRGRAGEGARRRAGRGARGRGGLGVRTRAQARRGGW